MEEVPQWVYTFYKCKLDHESMHRHVDQNNNCHEPKWLQFEVVIIYFLSFCIMIIICIAVLNAPLLKYQASNLKPPQFLAGPTCRLQVRWIRWRPHFSGTRQCDLDQGINVGILQYCLVSQASLRERSKFTGGAGWLNWGGGQIFWCTDMEGGGPK